MNKCTLLDNKLFLCKQWVKEQPIEIELTQETDYYYIAQHTAYPKTEYIAFFNLKQALKYLIYLYRLDIEQAVNNIKVLIEQVKENQNN